MEEYLVTDSVKQSLISSFVDIVCWESDATATRFLKATDWKLDEAIGLFYVQNESGAANQSSWGEGDVVWAPLPVQRANPGESRHRAVWEAGRSDASPDISQDCLPSLYRPPLDLMHNGSFEQAKVDASVQDKWLIINVQSHKEFNSHALNRDTWANDAVAETVKANFIFWQIDEDVIEGRKVCSFYNLDKFPAVLVIDPITGQKLRWWNGAIDPEGFLEDLYPYVDCGPKASLLRKHTRRPSSSSHITRVKTCKVDEEMVPALALSLASLDVQTGVKSNDEKMAADVHNKEETLTEKKPVYPDLPQEPKGDKSFVCKVGIRLPYSRRVQRNFLKTDSIKLLWAFCSTLLGEEDKSRTFHFTLGMASASKRVDYDSNLTFEESGLSNSLLLLTWD